MWASSDQDHGLWLRIASARQVVAAPEQRTRRGAATNLDAIAARLSTRGWGFADTGRTIEVADPWNTRVTLSLPGTTTHDLLAR